MSTTEHRLLPQDAVTGRPGGGIATWTHIDRQSLPLWLQKAFQQTEERTQFEPSDADVQDLLEERVRRGGENDRAAYELLSAFSRHVIYEDPDLLILNKPARLIAASRSNFKFSLEAVARYARGNDTYLVNRLDRATSGVIVLTKTPEAFINMQFQFADKEKAKMDKVFLALVDGEFKDGSDRQIDLLIGDTDAPNTRVITARPGENKTTDGEDIPKDVAMKGSQTIFSPLVLFHTKESPPRSKTLATVQISPGRTHQIRAAASVGLEMPVTADGLYGGRRFDAPRQMLHAYGLTFNHPTTGKAMTFEAPVPDDFERVVRGLTRIRSYSPAEKP
jgi:23S rRNA-/tRNA-specific pseudouridylate synthase